MAKKTDDKPIKFEEAIDQLEQIIERIESGEAGLEECLGQYEQGMKLIAQCRTILLRAEQRIAELSPDEDGQLQVAEGEVEEEEAD